MSSTTLRWGHAGHGRHRRPRSGDRRTLLTDARIAFAAAGVAAVMGFSIAAPLTGNPARRLFMLDEKPTVMDEFDRPSERTPDLSPSHEWVAIDTTDLETNPIVKMPALAVRGGAQGP
jgi:hypothetical protein